MDALKKLNLFKVSVLLLLVIAISNCSKECDPSFEFEKKEIYGEWGNSGFKINFRSNGTFTFSENMHGAISGKWKLTDRTMVLNYNSTGGKLGIHNMQSRIDEMYLCKKYHDNKILVNSNIFGQVVLISL